MAKSQNVSDELFDCLTLLWGDALHIFQNLQIDTTSSGFFKNWKIRLIRRKFGNNRTNLSRFTLQQQLISPRKENETFQDLERDFYEHLTQFDIEKDCEPHSVKLEQESEFLEDIKAKPGRNSLFCVLNAIKRVTPFRSSFEAQKVLARYSQEMSRMEWVARYHPSKSLLYKVSMVTEELKILKNTGRLQKKALDTVTNAVNRPILTKDAAITDIDVGVETYRRDSRLSNAAGLKVQKFFEDVEQLEDKGKRLAEQIRQLVDIKVEDNGKAIMVFTIVTVIFLPLSFVSSYFGMNTADVRNLELNQWIFWAVGGGTTIMVAAVVLAIAFQGTLWRIRSNERYLWDSEKQLKLH
ncbi:hypothetical protein MMC07_004457 [Pseudocyphellaria aurata]|nr:hypothetical protein [Pseudocyphellaria aurata]